MAFIDTAAHAKYFLRCLELLPAPYASLDTNRLTVAYFCVSGLDMLGAVERVDAKRVIEWIYSLQVLPPSGGAEGAAPGRSAGFRGGAFMGGPFCPDGGASSSEYDEGYLAMTYTALAVLVILKDDLRRIDRAALFRFVRSLQDRHGCFAAYSGGESDMRFLYCATAICTLMRDEEWSGVDVQAATAFVMASQNYDGGLGLGPGQESQGGSIYTGLAALQLMGTISQLPRRGQLIQWIVQRQVGGFQGRPNKDEDTCYSFWLGASLSLLGAPRITDLAALAAFAMSCECLPH